MTTETAAVAAATTHLERLRGSIRGPVIGPGDEGYDAARRIWNGAIDRHPACIVRCTGVADVVAAVRFARDHDLEIAVRGGGQAACRGTQPDELSPPAGATVPQPPLRTGAVAPIKRRGNDPTANPGSVERANPS